MNKIQQLVILFFLITFPAKAQIEPLLLYKAQQDENGEKWVEEKMREMNLKEKVAQLFIYTIAPHTTKQNLGLLDDAVKNHKVGGLLFSGGELRDQAILMNRAQEDAEIPLMMTFDGEWGLAMRIKTMPNFPRNMVLGCIQDDKLIYEYGKEVARELRELGVHVNFAPVADVNINPANPVINTRSFGEDPVNVADKVIAYASGLESGGVLSVSKHFPGHGDTDVDSHHALPLLPFERSRLDSIELYPFKQVINAGLGSIMVGHLQVPALGDKELPASISPAIVTGVLKDELQFNGLIFTDALAMKGVGEYRTVCLQALMAGNDMVLSPPNLKTQIQVIMDALKSGTITEEQIETKCRKVLRYKYALGIHEQGAINLSGLDRRISTSYADSLIQRLRMAAITVAGNQEYTLPYHSEVKEVAVLTIENNQNSNASFIRELNKYVRTVPITLQKELSASYIENLKKRLESYNHIIVSLNSRDLGRYDILLSELSENASVVYASFVPMSNLEKLPRSLSASSALIVGHSNEAVIQTQVAKVMFGKATANGRLSASIPGSFRVGEGVTISPESTPHYSLEELAIDTTVLAKIDKVVKDAIAERAFPGCQVYISRKGQPVYYKSFGKFTYDSNAHPVQNSDIYDLASLSKTTGTLLAVMKLHDGGKINITDKISDHLSYLKGTDKENITISDLLFHQSGLPSFIPFYQKALDKDSYTGGFIRSKPDENHKIQVGRNAYAANNFRFKEGLVSTTYSEEYSLHVADDFWLNRSFRTEEIDQLINATVKEKKYLYSCINFILLKELVEQITHQSMDRFLDEEFFRPMGLRHVAYLPLRTFSKEQIAPSVRNDYLRRNTKILQGFVHDEAAAFFGGVSGNAGLFASAEDVAAIHQLWLDGGVYRGKRYLGEETCRLFTTTVSAISRRGLGFDKPDPKDSAKSPCSQSAPASVYGHTGFTGTCAWVDPDNELVYVFLCNRTYPDPWNRKLMTLNVRPRIQEIMYNSLIKTEV